MEHQQTNRNHVKIQKLSLQCICPHFDASRLKLLQRTVYTLPIGRTSLIAVLNAVPTLNRFFYLERASQDTDLPDNGRRAINPQLKT